MYKKYAYQLKSGTEALIKALEFLQAKTVIIPTYTCTDILYAVKSAGCSLIVVDCGLDLQISTSEVLLNAPKADTVIIPHMFGIRADVKTVRDNTDLKIIEDLSQCHGLPDLGKYADIVVSSTNKSKWIDLNGGGVLFSDNKLQLTIANVTLWPDIIKTNFKRRLELAQELKNAGIKLVGSESSWLRGIYFTQKSHREPYIPLHKIVKKFDCPVVNSYIGKIDWVSIIV